MASRETLGARLVCAMLLALTACQDLPTMGGAGDPAPQGASTQNHAGGLHIGQGSFTCTLWRRAASMSTGLQSRRVTLFAPVAELAPRGRMVRYAMFRLAADGTLAYAADCLVPYTEAALRRVDRRFAVADAGGAEQFIDRHEMLTVQDCVRNEDTGCFIDPIVVIAPPVIPPCDACNYYPGGNGGDGGGGDWGGGTGTGTGGGLPGDADGDGDTLDEGPGAFALCVAIKLGAGGWSAIGGTLVTAGAAWDARKGTRAAYDAWDGYRRNAEAGIIAYDVSINDLYYKRWQDAQHQETLMYAGTAAAATWSALAIASAAAACAPLGAAPLP